MEENKDIIINEENNEIVEEKTEEELILEAELAKKQEYEEKMAQKQERFKSFKKAYNKAGLNVLLFFGILQVICSTFLYAGAILAVLLSGVVENVKSYGSVNDIVNAVAESEYFYLVGLFYIIGYVITIVLTIIINRKIIYGKDKNVEKNIKKLSFSQMLLAISIMLGLWGIGVCIGDLPNIAGHGIAVDDTFDILNGSTPWLFLAMSIFGAPFIEELVCRKFFIDKTVKYGENIAVLMSALLFGLMHANSVQFFLAFGSGLMMAIVYVKTRNILYTMVMHFTINFWVSSLEIAELLLNPEATQIFNYAWSITTLAIIIIGIVLAIIFILIKKKDYLIPKKNNEFPGSLTFKTAGIKIIFILSIVLIGLQDLINIFTEINTSIDNIDGIAILLQLFVDLVFVFAIIFIKKYINNKMYPRIEEPVE